MSKENSRNERSSKPNNIHIPAPKQTTREMEAERLEYAKKRQRQLLFRYRFRMVSIGILVIVIPIAIAVLSKRANKAKSDISALPATTNLSDLDVLLKNGDEYKLVLKLQEIDAQPMSPVVSIRFRALNTKLRVAERLIEAAQSDQNRDFGTLSKINALIPLSVQNVVNELNDKTVFQQLQTFSNQHVEDKDPRIRVRASLGILISSVCQYLTTDVGARDLKKLLGVFQTFPRDLDSDYVKKAEFESVVPFFARCENTQDISEFRMRFGDALKRNGDTEIKQIGANIQDAIVTENVDFDDLRVFVAVPIKDSIATLELLVAKIENSSFLSDAPFRQTLSVIENLKQIQSPSEEMKELPDKLVASLRNSCQQLEDERARKKVNQLLSEYDKRAGLLTQKFDVGTLDSNIEQANQRRAILFFSTKSIASVQALNLICNSNAILKDELALICVCTDKVPLPRVLERIKRENSHLGISIVEHPESALFENQCPVLFVPYFLVLNNEGFVTQVNANQATLSGN